MFLVIVRLRSFPCIDSITAFPLRANLHILPARRADWSGKILKKPPPWLHLHIFFALSQESAAVLTAAFP
jgi:hypothetical protein